MQAGAYERAILKGLSARGSQTMLHISQRNRLRNVSGSDTIRRNISLVFFSAQCGGMPFSP